MSSDILSRPPVRAQLRIPYGPDPSQFFDAWNPHNARGRLIIMIHGGFWRSQFDLTHASHLCAALARGDVMVASLEYRRVGATGGGWPQTFGDVLAGFDAVRTEFPHAAKPVLAGHSAGGHLALRLASEREEVSRVVALAPVACLDLAYAENLGDGAVAAFLGGSPEELPERYRAADPSRHASQVPRVCVHGSLDETVPLRLSQEFIERRKGDRPAPALDEIRGADHLDLIDPLSAAWPGVQARMEGFGLP